MGGTTAATGIGVIRCTCVGSWKLIKCFDQRAQHLGMVGGGGLWDKGLGAEQQQQQHLGYVKGLRMGQGRQRE